MKYQCINKIRKLIKEGKLKKEDMPNLEEFGFDRVVIPENKKEDNNNNDNNE